MAGHDLADLRPVQHEAVAMAGRDLVRQCQAEVRG